MGAIELLLCVLHLGGYHLPNGIIIDFFLTPCHFRVTLYKPPERVEDATWQSREMYGPPHQCTQPCLITFWGPDLGF